MWLFTLAAGLQMRSLMRYVKVDIYRDGRFVETQIASALLPPWI